MSAVRLQAAPPDSASALLAKARTAFQQNQVAEKHWNWTATEKRTLVDKAGQTVQEFPSVTAESVIRSDGRRCNAVVAWGDGKAPYLADSDTDSRCQAMDAFRPAFSVEALLAGGQVKLQSQAGAVVVLEILPDPKGLKSNEPAMRCAASIRASVELDPQRGFPRVINGEVAESGCDHQFEGIVQYDYMRRTGPLRTNFRKGATFRMEFAFQKDRFQTPANSYWICTEQTYSQPWNQDMQTLYYWGRQVGVRPMNKATRLLKQVHTEAREFGVESKIVGRLETNAPGREDPGQRLEQQAVSPPRIRAWARGRARSATTN